jgi:DnaJ-domain-containing protein 1
MHLPRRLSASTLGDLLGSLHRERITGTVELSEIGGPFGHGIAGRLHRVHLRGGLVAEVETPLPAENLRARMDALFSLADATIAFRTARPLPQPAALLGPADFLHGRPRARPRTEPPAQPPAADPRDGAYRMLGIPRGAGIGEVRRAFRQLAAALHPDRLASAALEEQQRQAARFAELSAAYHLLVA